jgi:uncharacterized membrane protein
VKRCKRNSKERDEMNLHDINEMVMHKPSSKRFIELDILRGFAIIGMIFLHILFDLDYFGIMPLNLDIYRFQKIIPVLFFLLVGMCLIVSKNKKLHLSKEKQKEFNLHVILRGLRIFSLGMIITTITLIFMPDKPIIFGVLHCIGLSIVFSVAFLKFKYYNILFATLIILAGLMLGGYPVENPTAIQLAFGLHPTNLADYTIDYFPLLPWFGITLLGIALGDWLYKDNKRRFTVPSLPNYRPFSVFSWMGRHSLAIYLIHQPVIAGILSLYLII